MPTPPPPKHSRFKKGQSGNPRGRVPGPPKAARELFKEILESGAEEVAKAILRHARKGNAAAMRIVADRVQPAVQEIKHSADESLPVVGGFYVTGFTPAEKAKREGR